MCDEGKFAMYEGKIIKFYREKYKITQEKLGKDICSVTHISKIECSKTAFAPEIIALLCKRLDINIEIEVAKLHNIKHQLFEWQEAIIMKLINDADQMNKELEQEELIQISDYYYMYQLLRARYLMMQDKLTEGYRIIKKVQKVENKMTPYETNLLKHVLGIYYLLKQEYSKAIETLKEIDNRIYNNSEYYYQLAVAYHTLESPVLAYYYAEKSHHYFKDMNNYHRLIDAEMLMIIQVKDDDDVNEEIIQRYKKLIKSCDLCSTLNQKAKVLHNLGYEYLRRKKYDLANRYFLESMSLKEKESLPYLISLELYIQSSYDGNLIPKDELINLAESGLTIALNNDYLVYIHIFRLLLYLLKSKEHQFYQYLSNKALPMFIKFGHVDLIKRSKKELFIYYKNNGLKDEALKIADFFINS